jgi:hypothetical protein
MKRSLLFRYGYVMIALACVLLPGCALWDRFFGSSEETMSEKEKLKKSSQEELQTIKEVLKEHEEEENVALETLAEAGTVLTSKGVTGKPLVTMNGIPIVTMESLEAEQEKLFEANADLKEVIGLSMNSAQFKRSFAEGLTNQAIIDREIVERGISETSEYKKELKEGFTAVERMVNTKFFTQTFDVHVNDAEVRKFYEGNKASMPQLITSRGGIKAAGVMFDTEQDARAFAAQVANQGNDLKKAAQVANIQGKVRDFMNVSQQSIGIDQELKNKLLGTSKFPTTDVVKTKDNKVWVVTAIEKEEPQYRPFEQVKAEIKDYLERAEQGNRFDEEIEKLKKKYDIKMDETFFTAEPNEAAEEGMLPEDLISQLEDDSVSGTVAYHDVDEPSLT